MMLKEDMQLKRGIFWIDDIDNISNSKLYFTIDCTSNGENLEAVDLDYSSKNGITYNHENTWKNISSKFTHNKPFNYFPRGRVEIRNSVATIYCSPYIYGEELLNWCKDKFNLTSVNGIKKIRMIADNSFHYHCYLDN